MRGHLDFLFANRKELRLKVNATEDLLLNGARQPTHRGQCVHLLQKVDLACLQSASARLDDGLKRSRLLAGAVRFSSDIGVLLMYLESLLEDASREEAAAAFGAAVRRIDFTAVSAARMRRVLELIEATFTGHQRVQVLFGLLSSLSFRDAFDRATDVLPDALASTFVPLRAVHEVVFEGAQNRYQDGVLEAGVATLLAAPEGILRRYPEEIRVRLLESAVGRVGDVAVADRATDALLASLPPASRNFSDLGMARARDLLRRHDDDQAEKLLRRIASAHSGFALPSQWLAALAAPRLGRVARVGKGRRDGDGAGRLVAGFWLDEQRPVWLRVSSAADPSRVAAEVVLQRELAVAGVAPVIASGAEPGGVSFVVMPAPGRPLGPLLRGAGAARLWLAVTQVLHTLARLGVRLPDADPARFLAEDAPLAAVQVADLDGAERCAVGEALSAHLGFARAGAGVESPALNAARDLPQLIAHLARVLG